MGKKKVNKGSEGAVDAEFDRLAEGLDSSGGSSSYHPVLNIQEDHATLKAKFLGIELKAGVASPVITVEALAGTCVTRGNKGVAGSGGLPLVPGEVYDLFASGQLAKTFATVVRDGKGKNSRIVSVTPIIKGGTVFAVRCQGKKVMTKGEHAGMPAWGFDIRVDAKGKLKGGSK